MFRVQKSGAQKRKDRKDRLMKVNDVLKSVPKINSVFKAQPKVLQTTNECELSGSGSAIEGEKAQICVETISSDHEDLNHVSCGGEEKTLLSDKSKNELLDVNVKSIDSAVNFSCLSDPAKWINLNSETKELRIIL